MQTAAVQPGVSTMDDILEEAAEDAQAAVESAQRHSSKDIVNVGLAHMELRLIRMCMTMTMPLCIANI